MEKNQFAHQDRMNKLSPKWEGPHPNAYILEDEEGKRLDNTFNVEHFK